MGIVVPKDPLHVGGREDFAHHVEDGVVVEGVTDFLELYEKLLKHTPFDGIDGNEVKDPLDARPPDDEPAFAPEVWHRLGSIHPEVIRCPGCGREYEADDEAAELPACPGCALADTWEARQDPGLRALVAGIEACASLQELAALGKRLYALRLSHDQAGVAWSHYQIRKAKVEAGLALGLLASAVLQDVHGADARLLPRFGAWLYRRQRVKGSALSSPEWRRIWRAYQARRAAWAA